MWFVKWVLIKPFPTVEVHVFAIQAPCCVLRRTGTMKRQRGYEETERKVRKVKVDEHAPDEEDAKSEVDEQKQGPTLEALVITQGGSQLEGSSVPQGVEVCSLSCIPLN